MIIPLCYTTLSLPLSLSLSLSLSPQDAILSIGSAMTAVEFRDTVKSGIHLAFLSVKQSLVMLLDIESNVLAYYESNTSFKTLTKDGVIW